MATPRETFFEADEYTRRRTAVQNALVAEGADLLVTCSPGNICYLNGYVSVNVHDTMFLGIPVQGTPVFYLWQFERGRAESSVTGSETVCWETGDDPVAFAAEDLARRRLNSGHTIVDTGGTYATFDLIRRLMDALNAAPNKGLVETIRLVKSPVEHGYVRQAAVMTDAATRAALNALREGASDFDIAAAAEQALLEADSEFASVEPIICVGWRSGTPHSPRGGTRVEAGEPVFIELSGVKARYHAPIMRTGVVGRPRPEAQQLADYSNACLEALLGTIKAGVLGSEVAAAGKLALAPIRDRIAFHDLFGYSVGISYPPDWIENAAFYLGADNHNPLLAGMVFHLPLTLRKLGKYGAGFSETIIVTETGAEPLSRLPRELAAGG